MGQWFPEPLHDSIVVVESVPGNEGLGQNEPGNALWKVTQTSPMAASRFSSQLQARGSGGSRSVFILQSSQGYRHFAVSSLRILMMNHQITGEA
jgi:hypothetical protein